MRSTAPSASVTQSCAPFSVADEAPGGPLHPQRECACLRGKRNGGVEAVGECGHLIPARMKLCTNCRWNSRKATSSGALVMSVAAVTIDQSMP